MIPPGVSAPLDAKENARFYEPTALGMPDIE